MRKIYILFTCLLLTLPSFAEVPVSLLPKPQQYKETGKSFPHGSILPITVRYVHNIPEAGTHQEEAYQLKVTPEKVSITAVTETGAYRARQTWEQLQMLEEIPYCEITDWPAFSIRGFMQDCGRSYMSLQELKQEIDLLSRFKMNVFHWHLTENQAWRLESKRYPQLNAPENMTRHEGRFYTQEEARDLMHYCAERHVTLIPELDMPGHSAAFERTFGVKMESAEGTSILKELVQEACEVFNEVPYFHIGTDEAETYTPHFVPEMVSFVRGLGKKAVSWNPGFNYKAGEIDMTMLWGSRGKVQEGIPAVDLRLNYLNHFDNFADIIGLYTSRVGDVEEEGNVVGSMVAIWNDRKLATDREIVLQNGLYPHALATAERAWIGGGYQYFDDFGTMLPKEGSPAYVAFLDFENRMLWHKDRTFANVPFGYVRQTHQHWTITDAFPNDGDLEKVFPPEEKLDTSYTYGNSIYQTRKATGAGIYLRHVWGTFVPGFYKNPQPNHTAYAYTWVYSPREQEVGLLTEFQNYSRSEKDAPAPQGQWDVKHSKIWINGKEIIPPIWRSDTSKEITNETLMTNENALGRPIIPVVLQKGFNKVLLKLPVGEFRTPQVRLVKWMFCCTFVTLDGRKEVENLIYSAENP